MKYNKGFTLVELLAVITIIAIVSLITIPVVIRNIQGTGERIYKTNENSLAIAAKNYYMEHIDYLPKNIGDTTLIFLDDLIDKGFIKQIKDLQDRSLPCEGYVVIEKATDRVYNYTPYLKCGADFITDGYYDLPPVITILGENPIAIEIGSTYIDAGATARDVKDGDITASIVTENNVDTSIEDVYTVTYTVTNSSGITAQNIRTVNVSIDATSPVITLLGTSPVTIECGNTYVDAGATALDNKDGDITDHIIVNNPVDTSIPNTYIVTYNVTDSSGNIATEVTRIVNVVDVTPPVITLLGNNPTSIALGSTYVDAGATALDDIDGNITANIVVTNPVDTNVLGQYIVRYNVSDSSGNAAIEVTRTVNVVAPPMNFAYTGAVQTYTIPTSGTYKLEVWGAQGGSGYGSVGGKGGYATGEISLTAGEIINIYVGSIGGANGSPGYNGGGWGGWGAIYDGGGGGGATDMRRGGTALGNRIIVAGAGGGGGYTTNYGGVGGNPAGNGGQYPTNGGGGATTSAGGVAATSVACGSSIYPGPGTLGNGGSGTGGDCTCGGAGGGGGYYGGGGGSNNGGGGGGGGSSYTGSLTNAQIIAGNATMPAPGGGTETGQTNNGYARISFISQ